MLDGARSVGAISARNSLVTQQEAMRYRYHKFNESFEKRTHYIFRYPAKFHPPVARFLIESFSRAGEHIVDPFCGSGTLLVEGAVAGRQMFGVDIDPIACFVSSVKTTALVGPSNFREIEAFASYLELSWPAQSGDPWVPRIPNIDHWFEAHVLREIAIVWQEINKSTLLTGVARNIARCAFLACIRGWSNADPVPVSGLEVTKHIREKRSAGFFPDVIRQYLVALRRTAEAVKSFSEAAAVPKASVYQSTADEFFRRTRRRFDAIITSPPYLTAVDYYRRHTLEMFWLDQNMDQPTRWALKSNYIGQYQVNRKMVKDHEGVQLNDRTLKIANKISASSQQRAGAFLHYYKSMKSTIMSASRRLQPGGSIIIVLGDGRINNTKIRTSGLLADEIADVAQLEESIKYPVPNRYMTYARRNGADIGSERILVFRTRK